jgi:hypothetical protein
MRSISRAGKMWRRKTALRRYAPTAVFRSPSRLLAAKHIQSCYVQFGPILHLSPFILKHFYLFRLYLFPLSFNLFFILFPNFNRSYTFINNIFIIKNIDKDPLYISSIICIIITSIPIIDPTIQKMVNISNDISLLYSI